MRAEGIILSALLLVGCSTEQIGDAFELPLYEYDAKWNPDRRWTIEDIHVYMNIEIEEQAIRNHLLPNEKYLNGTCLLSAERKYWLALQHGFQEKDLEIVVIRLTKDAALKADWSRGWPTHAVLRYKGEIFDNGFISKTPFDIEDLSRYGEIVPDQWSKYHTTK